MRVPDVYVADEFIDYGVSREVNGKWCFARPVGLWSFCVIQRVRIAWRVFTGRYDALTWAEDEEK